MAGAKYVVPVAEHHDGFSMYASGFNSWNSVAMGPKRGVIGGLHKAAIKYGLYFGLSSHKAENAWFFNGGKEFPSDVRYPKNSSLYGQLLDYPGVILLKHLWVQGLMKSLKEIGSSILMSILIYTSLILCISIGRLVNTHFNPHFISTWPTTIIMPWIGTRRW